jgi:hypothetical protein
MPMLVNSRMAAQMQRLIARDFYSDTALLIIDVASGAVDALNVPTVTATEVPVKCSYSDNPNSESWSGLGDIAQLVGEIRFQGPTPTKGNRVKITSRFGGQPLPPTTLEIFGIADRAALGFVCALKAVSL